MQIHWQKKVFLCPTCKAEMWIMELCTSADGELKITLGCETCAKTVVWQRFYSQLTNNDDMALDIESAKLATPAQPPQKQKLLPSVKPDHTAEDDKFLHRLGMEWGKE